MQSPFVAANQRLANQLVKEVPYNSSPASIPRSSLENGLSFLNLSLETAVELLY
jgi:hypothetical protein